MHVYWYTDTLRTRCNRDTHGQHRHADKARALTCRHARRTVQATFFHKIYETEIGKVKGHFGPINSISFNPDGRSFTSGSEDGYVRIHHFDPEYFSFE